MDQKITNSDFIPVKHSSKIIAFVDYICGVTSCVPFPHKTFTFSSWREGSALPAAVGSQFVTICSKNPQKSKHLTGFAFSTPSL